MAIVVVGSVALDTIKTKDGFFKKILGGSATYFSLGARPFADIRLVAAIGNDLGAEKLKFLDSPRIGLSGLEVVDGKTFQWAGSYSSDFSSRQTTGLDLGVFANFKPVIPDDYKHSSTLFLANINPNLQEMVLSQMKKPRLIAVDTIDHWIKNARKKLLKLLKTTDMIFLNEEEARLLTQLNSYQAMGSWLRRHGPSLVIIKQGCYGALGWFRNSMVSVPAYPVEETIDPTGAGDSFAGGVLGVLDRSKKIDKDILRDAMFCGSVIGSFCVEGVGVSAIARLKSTEFKRRLLSLKKISGLK
jgi:sugar/nucleoside kinase (ribokinase family)